MPIDTKKFFSWLVFLLSAGAYAPLLVGGWQHPSEMNLASYSLWIVLAIMFVGSSKKSGFAGWRMPLGYLVGNVVMVAFGLSYGGYTFNLDRSGALLLFGIVSTIATWVIVGNWKGRWDVGILYLGGIIADAISFYPQIKQYLLPHDPPTLWFISAWVMFWAGALVNLCLVEELPQMIMMDPIQYRAIMRKEKSISGILKESAYSIENVILVPIALWVMLG